MWDPGLKTFWTREKPLVLHPRTRWQSKLRETGKLICHTLVYRQSLREHLLCQLSGKRSPRGLLYSSRFYSRLGRAIADLWSSSRRRRVAAAVGRRRVPSLGIDARCGIDTRTKSTISSPLGTYQTLVQLAIYFPYVYSIVTTWLEIADRVESQRFLMRRRSDHTRSSTTWSNINRFSLRSKQRTRYMKLKNEVIIYDWYFIYKIFLKIV